MNDNNYVLLPQVKIGFIYNHIQTVVPFVLDESLDTYNLLRKLVDYCNELGARSNELQYILKDLVDFLNNKLNEQKDYINNFLETLHQEWLDYKQSLEDKYDAFTEQVDTLFEQYKAQIRDEYNQELANIRTNNNTLYNNLKNLLDEKITELTNYANSIEPNIDSYIDEKDQAIKDLITNFQNEFTEYQKTVNAELVELGDTLTQLINTNEQNVVNQINSKTQEIVNTLSNVNMQELVNNKLNEYDSEELSDLFTNLYGSLIRITYMNTDTPPTVVSETPIYHYNPDTGVLTDCTTGNEALILTNSLYLYEGRLFYPILEINTNDVEGESISNPTLVGYNEDLTIAILKYNNVLYKLDTTTNILTNTGINMPLETEQHGFIALYHNDIYYGAQNNLYKYNNDANSFEIVDITEINPDNQSVRISVCNNNCYIIINRNKLYRYDTTFTFIGNLTVYVDQVLDDRNGYIIGTYGLQITYFTNELIAEKTIGTVGSNQITQNNVDYFVYQERSIYNDNYFTEGYYKKFINGIVMQVFNKKVNIGILKNDSFEIIKSMQLSFNHSFTFTLNGKVYTSNLQEVTLINKLQEIPYQRSDS